MDWFQDPVKDLRAAYEAERRKPHPSWVRWEWIEAEHWGLRILRLGPKHLASRKAVISYFHGGPGQRWRRQERHALRGLGWSRNRLGRRIARAFASKAKNIWCLLALRGLRCLRQRFS